MAEEKKEMKKQFAKLSKIEQEKIEAEYHNKRPEEFDNLMSRAKTHSPDAIRLPARLAATLKTMAELEGEPEYQTMVRRWVEERLQQERKLAAKLSKRSPPRKVAALKRQVAK